MKSASPRKLQLNTDSSPPRAKKPERSRILPQHRGITLDTKDIATEVRRDYLHDTMVIIAPNRSHRPYDTKDTGHTLIETAASPRLDDNSFVWQMNASEKAENNWLVKVVENKFPSLTTDNPKAYGKQEIVIDTPLAATPLAYLSKTQIANVIKTYQIRTSELLTSQAIQYVQVFRNDGYEAGASLAHAHSQIFALPFVPQKFAHEADNAEDYVAKNNRNPYDDIISFEKNAKDRVICENDRFLVFCPYASQWPFEITILPKRQFHLTSELTEQEVADLAGYFQKYLKKLTRNKISYNLYFENGVSPNHRFSVHICGRSNIWGGFEVATGMVINTVPPESAAKWYRA